MGERSQRKNCAYDVRGWCVVVVAAAASTFNAVIEHITIPNGSP